MSKPNIRFIDDAVRVKNAKLVYDYNTEKYSLIHYDTEILTLDKNLNVLKALKCSNSSTRAINQALDFLKIDRNKVHLEPYTNFVKYRFSFEKHRKKGDFMEVLEN